MPPVHEVNFDGLIGPTHNFAGLALGNLAANFSKYSVSHPKKAALEGLAKMKLLYSLGVKQGFIPPHIRPHIHAMRHDGYRGEEEQILKNAAKKGMDHLLPYCSASSMWTANAATVSPSMDSADGKVHLTIANLISNKHRAMEAETTTQFFKQIFRGGCFKIHQPLTKPHLFDEGAANHMRLCESHDKPGLHLFIYGKTSAGSTSKKTNLFPARQSLEASQEVARLHGLKEGQTVFIQQNPAVIDQGVFHNDVIAASNENFLFFHEAAFVNKEDALKEIDEKFHRLSKKKLSVYEVKDEQLSVKDAVNSYLFNSQIVTLSSGDRVMIAPKESQQGGAREVIDALLRESNFLKDVRFVSLNESMLNGGGPACLRLRVVLTEKEWGQVHPGSLLTEKMFDILKHWIHDHYRERLHFKDFQSVEILHESRRALDHLAELLNLGEIYKV